MNSVSEKTQHHTVDILFILGLFLVFAATAVSVVFIGIRIYRQTIQTMDSNYNTRTCSSYIIEKIHQHDSNASVSCDTVSSVPVLKISSSGTDKDYTTYIYVYDGYLKESLLADNYVFSPSDGQNILAAVSMDLEQTDSSVISVTIETPAHEKEHFFISVRSSTSQA